MSRELLPFAYDASQNSIRSSQLLSTDAHLSQLRKREFPTSDSLEDFTTSKRFHEFTDDSISESLFIMNSSPPLGPVDEEDINENLENADEDLNSEPWKSSNFNGYQEAIFRIQGAIDNGASTVNLEELELESIPDEFKDLADLVTIHPPGKTWISCIHAYLSNNLLHLINPVVFDVTNITVLTLRNNKLKELPPAIGKLRNLKDLSIGGNRLKWLPTELMNLEYLCTVSVHPNPFLSMPDSWLPPPTPPSSQFSFNCLVAESHINKRYDSQGVQSLAELCMKVLADNIINERETRRWNLVPTVDDLVSEAMNAQKQNITCFMCKNYMVRGVGYVLEWWDGFKGLRLLPFQKNICSHRCYEHYKSKSMVGKDNLE